MGRDYDEGLAERELTCAQRLRRNSARAFLAYSSTSTRARPFSSGSSTWCGRRGIGHADHARCVGLLR